MSMIQVFNESCDYLLMFDFRQNGMEYIIDFIYDIYIP